MFSILEGTNNWSHLFSFRRVETILLWVLGNFNLVKLWNSIVILTTPYFEVSMNFKRVHL